MKVDLKKLPQSQVELTITVPYSVYKDAEKKALETINKTIKIDGFRSGNIPEAVIREKVGAQAIKGETLEKVFPMTYSKAVQEHDIAVIAPPEIDIKSEPEKEGDDLVYVATVNVMPEAKIGNYKAIKVAKEPVKVEAKQIDETIQMVMDRYATWKDIERDAKAGDRAEIKFDGYDDKGELIPNTSSKNHPVILGSNTMIPGFEDAIVGMKVNDDKSFDVTFPDDYHAKEMQGKKVTFKVHLNRLEEKETQTLNEAMIEQITGEKKSVDDFRKLVEEDLSKEMEARSNNQHQENIIQEIVKITEVDLPQSLIDQEIDWMIDEQKKRIEQQGLNWDQYLTHLKKTDEEVRKSYQANAESRLKARLGIQRIVEAENITTDDAELAERKKDELAKFPNAKDAIEKYYEDPKNVEQLQRSMIVDKLMRMLTK